ncbi:MAG: arylsulfatase, partial [bacterium]|nr:arylsulfatase [bacterium]
PIVVGSSQENPARLSACDWNEVYCDNPSCYRAGASKSGHWKLRVAKAGRYRFSLRRWPKESGLKLTEAAPPLKGVDGGLSAGKPLPIARARISVGDFHASADAAKNATELTFQTALQAGETTLQTWFHDSDGKELAGAYYVWVERLAD